MYIMTMPHHIVMLRPSPLYTPRRWPARATNRRQLAGSVRQRLAAVGGGRRPASGRATIGQPGQAVGQPECSKMPIVNSCVKSAGDPKGSQERGSRRFFTRAAPYAQKNEEWVCSIESVCAKSCKMHGHLQGRLSENTTLHSQIDSGLQGHCQKIETTSHRT